VGVGGYQLDAVQAPVAQATQKLRPELLGLAVADIDAQNFAVPVGGDARWRSRPPGTRPGR
jgi:hypothetical protein